MKRSIFNTTLASVKAKVVDFALEMDLLHNQMQGCFCGSSQIMQTKLSAVPADTPVTQPSVGHVKNAHSQ